jgi:alpha-galactosidase
MGERHEGREVSLTLSGGGLAMTLVHDGGAGFRLQYFGPDCGEAEESKFVSPVLPAGPDAPPGPRLMPQRANGYDGRGFLDAVALPDVRAVRLLSSGMEKVSDDRAVLFSDDPALGCEARLELHLSGGLLRMRGEVRNDGEKDLLLNRCAALLLPLPDWAQETVISHGAWAREGHQSRRPLDAGFIGRASRLGRTGFGGLPGMILYESGATERSGKALGVQLEWSGSHDIGAERLRDGAAEVWAEALYEPGEILLRPGEVFSMPNALVALSWQGFDGLSDIWHDYVRRHSRTFPRPVHFNTWEACHYDFDEASLIQLAAEAADLGAERFVLDDGWFNGRRKDTTSLGDWIPDEERFPNGLAPLITAVHAQGMSFGLWVEPEMVSRQSSLYRQHPDWVLGFPDEKAPTGRNQLVLDLGNPRVRDYLFEALSAVLRTGGIDYLKWDCNRELYPADLNGQMRADAQVKGVYALLHRFREEFPDLAIESCASGGGRIDFGILPYVMRFWASDATDALDRIRIQDTLARCLPLEWIGTHVGPSPNPITGRTYPMVFRGLVALFGHLGVEMDPADLSAGDRQTLQTIISLNKAYRALLSNGTYRVLVPPSPDLHVSVVMDENGDEFLLRVLRTGMSTWPLQPRFCLPDLPIGASFRVCEIDLRSGERKALGIVPAALLALHGLQADPRQPLHGRLFQFKRAE